MANLWDDLKRQADDLLDGGDLEEASRAAERALALAEQAGNPPHPDIAEIHHALGAIRRRQGLHAQAEAFHRRALEVDASGTYRGRPGLGYHLLGLALCALGKDEEAAEAIRLAKEKCQSAVAPEALASVSRIDAEIALGRLAEAEDFLWEAMARAVQGRDDCLVIQLLVPVADIHRARGRAAELAFLRMGVAMLQQRLNRQV